jgi:RNA recognition motif-containing protein
VIIKSEKRPRGRHERLCVWTRDLCQHGNSDGLVLRLRVRSIDIHPKINGKSLGIAKVQMGSAEEANRAIEIMNQATLNGRVLVVFKEPDLGVHPA